MVGKAGALAAGIFWVLALVFFFIAHQKIRMPSTNKNPHDFVAFFL